MIKSYKVAEHLFSFSFRDDSPLWDRLDQYKPFETAVSEAPAFTLSFSDSLPEGEMVTVYDVPTEDGETVVRLYRQGQDWVFEMSPDHRVPVCARLWADHGFSEGRLQMLSDKLGAVLFSVNNAAMLLYAFRTITENTLEMHASVIGNGGKSYLFLGRSGTGKSTHSRLWLENIPGSELMNDDNPIVRAWPDGRIVAYGSPWSGKTPCYRNVEAPVGAFVRIRQCPENRIERLGIVESYAAIYSSCSGFKSEREMADAIHGTIEQVVLNVPCYLLDCRPDAEAADLCASTVR